MTGGTTCPRSTWLAVTCRMPSRIWTWSKTSRTTRETDSIKRNPSQDILWCTGVRNPSLPKNTHTITQLCVCVFVLFIFMLIKQWGFPGWHWCVENSCCLVPSGKLLRLSCTSVWFEAYFPVWRRAACPCFTDTLSRVHSVLFCLRGTNQSVSQYILIASAQFHHKAVVFIQCLFPTLW